MDFKVINSKIEFEKVVKENTAALLYFSTLSCSVGEFLQPKIIDLLKTDFQKIPFYYVDMQFNAELSAFCNVFVEPTVLVYFYGKESLRKSRNFGIPELSVALQRLYKLSFPE